MASSRPPGKRDRTSRPSPRPRWAPSWRLPHYIFRTDTRTNSREVGSGRLFVVGEFHTPHVVDLLAPCSED